MMCMATIRATYSPVILLLFLLVLLMTRSQRLSRPRVLAVLLVVSLSISIPIQMMNLNYLAALDQGQFTFIQYRTVTINPGGTYQTAQLSNWYAVTKPYEPIEFYSEHAFTFYVVDENRPGIRHLEANYTEGDLYLQLPYLYTDSSTVANWTARFYNPSDDQTIEVVFYTHSVPNGGPFLSGSIDYQMYMPLVIMASLSIFFAVVFIRKRTRTRFDHSLPNVTFYLVILFTIMVILTLQGFSNYFVTALLALAFLFEPPAIGLCALMLFIVTKPEESMSASHLEANQKN